MSQNPNLFLSIGKPVKDEYGRAIGKVASFAMTPNGKFDAVFLEFSSGRFSKQPIEQLKFNGAEVTLISTTKSQANTLCDQIPLIWRKDDALKGLSEKKKISLEMYQEIHNSFNGVLNQLKKDAQILSEEIADQTACCEEEIKAMSYAILQDNLKRASMEKNELGLAKTKLSNMLLGDSSIFKQKLRTPVELADELPQELPEPPVVVYVKEVGKAGI